MRIGRLSVWMSSASFALLVSAVLAAINGSRSDTVLAFLSVPVALAALVLGMVALRAFAVVLAVITVLVTAIAAPGFSRACCSGTEATAIGSLRAINSGQASYSASCAAGGYAVDLADLVRAPGGGSQGFIAPDLYRNGVVKYGYVLKLEKDRASGVTDVGSAAATCNGSTHQPASSYFVSANPLMTGETATRYFATDARGTVFFSATGPVPNPIPSDALVVQ